METCPHTSAGAEADRFTSIDGKTRTMTPGLRLPGAGGPVFSRLLLKIIAVFLITLLLALAYNGPDRSKWFFWHPFFALLAVLPLSTGGIFLNVYNAALKGGTKNSTTTSGRPAEQRIPNVFHNVAMIAATVCMWVAFYVIYTNKELNAKPHLTSWHSWIGVTVLLGYTGASLPAVLALWDYPLKMPSKVVVSTLRSAGVSMSRLAMVHRYVGRSAYALALAALVTGWLTTHAASPPLARYAIALAPLPIVGLVW